MGFLSRDVADENYAVPLLDDDIEGDKKEDEDDERQNEHNISLSYSVVNFCNPPLSIPVDIIFINDRLRRLRRTRVMMIVMVMTTLMTSRRIVTIFVMLTILFRSHVASPCRFHTIEGAPPPKLALCAWVKVVA